MSVILNDRDVLMQATVPRNIDPSAGKALLLQADTNAFHVALGGAGSPASITLRAQPINIPGSVTWSITAGGTLTGTGNTRSLAFSAMSADQVTVTAQIIYNGVTYSQSQTISKVLDGATGLAGDKTATAYLYQWAASTPAAPTGASTYTWATGVNSAYSVVDGWAVAVPANPGTPGLQLFTAAKTLTVASSVTTSTLSYSTATIASVAMNGATGNAGAPGVRTAIARAYQWGLSAPTASGSATWTWATASYNTVPVTGWSATKPAAPGDGYTLYEVSVSLVDGTTATTSAINWSTGSVASIGYIGINGTNGATGGTGATGAAARIAYTLADAFTLNLTPATFTATGTGKPTTGTWGETRVWVDQSTTAPTAGQAWFQSNGIYDGTNTIWGVPYLTNLKAGSLSVLSANLGSITAGDVHGAQFHGGAINSWAWPAAGAGGGFFLGPNGLLVGNFNDGRYFKVDVAGNLYAPSFSIINGVATFSGALSAATGTFAGSLSAATGTFSGSLSAATGTFAGDIETTGHVIARGTTSFNGAAASIVGSPSNSSSIGVLGETGNYLGVYGRATAAGGGGVSGDSVTGLGVSGYSISGVGAQGTSAYGLGVRGAGNTYDFYANGAGVNYGPFTGGHDGLAALDFEPEQGDILIDAEIAHHGNISNTIAVNALSSAPMQAAVIGVFVGQRPLDPENPPAALQHVTGLAFMAEVYKSITLNAVGEGQVNVCGEGGDIEAGDYITTSSIPGKGMRQADDVLHNYTVAKARESVTFADPSEIRMIACTYHCG